MSRRTSLLLLALAMLGSMLPAASATARSTAGELARAKVALAGSPNMAHVANLPHAKVTPSGKAAKGSDLEFAKIDVTNVPEAMAAGLTGVRDYAVLGTINIDSVPNSGMQIVDITDPKNPV